MPATEDKRAKICPSSPAHAFNVHTMTCVAPTALAAHAECMARALRPERQMASTCRARSCRLRPPGIGVFRPSMGTAERMAWRSGALQSFTRSQAASRADWS